MNDDISLDPAELFALARVNLDRGELEAALIKLKRVAADPQPIAEALVTLARLYAQLGLLDRAQPLFERYIELKPDAVHETFELGMTYFDTGKTDSAMSFWSKVLDTEPTHPPALFYSGLALARGGKYADAKHSLDILLKSAPPDNLYFTKGRDLLREIDQGLAPSASLPQADTYASNISPYFSKTEH